MNMTKEIWLSRINTALVLALASGKRGLEVVVTPQTRTDLDELGVLDALPSSVIVTVVGEIRGNKATSMIVDELVKQAKAAAWPFPAALPGYNWMGNPKFPGEAKNPLDEGTRPVEKRPELKYGEDFAKAVAEIREQLKAEPEDSATVSLYRDTFDAVHNVLMAMCHAYTDENPATLKRITIEVIE
jgi:hypothetical protein